MKDILSLALSAYTDPHCNGKQVIVHLFEWKWTDIANECERYLGKTGFCGVQVSPANEHVIVTQPNRPWWERYQPVSYKVHSRSGTEAEFKDMVLRCKNVGVRIYVDVVVNHMAGLGRKGVGTGGSSFNSDNYDFPGVPFRREHFNDRNKCPSHDGNVNNYGDPNNVRNCFLVGLTDLNQNEEYVRDKIAGYFDHMIDLGVAGFRVDAAKHMWPNDLKAIQERVKNLPEGGRPFFYHEVIDQNDGAIQVNEYYDLGYVTEFRYCQKIAQGVHNFGDLHGVYDPGWGMSDPNHAFVFVDNHDNQRGHGGGGNLITHKQPHDYRLAVAFTLAFNYGFTRVMSSYFFQNPDQGPPSNGDGSTKDVPINADGSCGNGWVCEHRWKSIGNMAAFRNAVVETGVLNWKEDNNKVSFSRGDIGFFAMSKNGQMDEVLQTGLPQGQYCDLISECQKTVTVGDDGRARIVINNNEDPVLALLIGTPSRSNSSVSGSVDNQGGSVLGKGTSPSSLAPSHGPPPESFARTVILIHAITHPGHNLFIRGGIDHIHRKGCRSSVNSNPCVIPIHSRDVGSGKYYEGYNAWKTGDNYLDWYGAESGQSSYYGQIPRGTPAVKTTNQVGQEGYSNMNKYGDDYWLIDIDMDCSKTMSGWFEFKAVINFNWERDMFGTQTCDQGPFPSNNHWARSLSAYTDPHCNGKQVIVHLFEWKWTDIANECERFLGKKGFCGVQVSPANEHVMVTQPNRPWWERYQPVSYKVHSRSGTEAEFKDMVLRCKNVGVRIYVDVVVNHMAGLGRKGVGTGGSSFNSDNYDFPGVPFRREHFNDRNKCPSHDGNVNNYGDPNNVRNCFLVGLTDLNQNEEYVRDKIAGYFDHMIDLGVAGFRVDAAKHMWPNDMKAIQERVKNLPEGGRPFFYHEVIDQNDGAIKVNEYYDLGYVTEFRYCQKIAQGVHNFGDLHGVYDPGWGMSDPNHAFVFVDNHDNQRGHGGGGNLITHKQPHDYRLAVAFTLAYNYGFTRVMSSYFFQNSDQGPPSNGDGSPKDVPINSDGSCGNGWVCEHRWKSIGNMAAFRNAVAGTGVQNWRDVNNQVSFSRGNKGFFAMSKNGHMDETLQTGLPAGQYCDLISECQKKVTVGSDGRAHIVINSNEDPVLAIIVGGLSGSISSISGGIGSHGESGSGSQGTPFNTPSPSFGPPPKSFARTVILMHAITQPGQNLFIRGGIDHSHRKGCSQDVNSNPCAIPIHSRDVGTGKHYEGYNTWKTGDNYLDWYGAEPGQSSYHGQVPMGTPAVWTTNQVGRDGYTDLNSYGDHYWLVDVDMDCSKTMNGWFEFKAVINTNWEKDQSGGQTCGQGPYNSNNHWARCGMKNVFSFNSFECEITTIS
ncbi:hypothetical protein FSP39_010394 [Pinctada imbricata]|uniref:alpha-amylase n=1 Tax=Pinctada imbricata TaxID=66713 RepID=A0AA88YDL4_PINIB|nr:hypothetical protein FSP39_010394 [Pinctada imbricata]